jgi:hypothetical protein
LVNHQYLGDEPILTDNFTETEYGNALTWYTYMSTTSDAREYLETFLKDQNRLDDLKKLKRVSDSSFPLSAAWAARLISRGTKVKESTKTFIEANLQRVFSKFEKAQETEAKPAVATVSIQQRVKDKADDILGEIENIVDDRANQPDFSLYDWLKKKSVQSVYASMIPGKYVFWLQELLDALDGADDQLVEAYARVPKKKMEYDIKFLSMLIEDAERYSSNTKKIRTPRKPRPMSVDKLLKTFKYQKEFLDMKIASVKPETIIGCQELWTYNTKYKTITVFRAIDRGGLSVKGTSIIKYDESNSFTKRTGRKSEEYVNRVLKSGKILLRKLLDEMKSDAPLAYRCNENTVLLKVV